MRRATPTPPPCRDEWAEQTIFSWFNVATNKKTCNQNNWRDAIIVYEPFASRVYIHFLHLTNLLQKWLIRNYCAFTFSNVVSNVISDNDVIFNHDTSETTYGRHQHVLK